MEASANWASPNRTSVTAATTTRAGGPRPATATGLRGGAAATADDDGGARQRSLGWAAAATGVPAELEAEVLRHAITDCAAREQQAPETGDAVALPLAPAPAAWPGPGGSTPRHRPRPGLALADPGECWAVAADPRASTSQLEVERMLELELATVLGGGDGGWRAGGGPGGAAGRSPPGGFALPPKALSSQPSRAAQAPSTLDPRASWPPKPMPAGRTRAPVRAADAAAAVADPYRQAARAERSRRKQAEASLARVRADATGRTATAERDMVVAAGLHAAASARQQARSADQMAEQARAELAAERDRGAAEQTRVEVAVGRGRTRLQEVTDELSEVRRRFELAERGQLQETNAATTAAAAAVADNTAAAEVEVGGLRLELQVARAATELAEQTLFEFTEEREFAKGEAIGRAAAAENELRGRVSGAEQGRADAEAETERLQQLLLAATSGKDTAEKLLHAATLAVDLADKSRAEAERVVGVLEAELSSWKDDLARSKRFQETAEQAAAKAEVAQTMAEFKASAAAREAEEATTALDNLRAVHSAGAIDAGTDAARQVAPHDVNGSYPADAEASALRQQLAEGLALRVEAEAGQAAAEAKLAELRGALADVGAGSASRAAEYEAVKAVPAAPRPSALVTALDSEDGGERAVANRQTKLELQGVANSKASLAEALSRKHAEALEAAARLAELRAAQVISLLLLTVACSRLCKAVTCSCLDCLLCGRVSSKRSWPQSSSWGHLGRKRTR